MVSLRTLFSLFAVVSASSNICPEGPDRNLKVYVAFDATSAAGQPLNALPLIGAGLLEVEKWVTGAGHEMSVSTAQAGDPTKTGSDCFAEHFVASSVAEAVENMSAYYPKTYKVNGAPIVQSVMYLLMTHWANESIHKERRIVMVVSTDPIRFGDQAFQFQPGKTLADHCPITTRTTVAQFGETFRSNGLGLLYYVWNPYQTDGTKWERSMIEYITEAGITDYTTYGRGGKVNEAAQQDTEDGLRQLACHSWIATTTTYRPPVDTLQVESCIMNAQQLVATEIENCLNE